MKAIKKLHLILSIILYSFYSLNAQPWYGQITYPHDSTGLTSAILTYSNAGYLMAGSRPNGNGSQPNAVIDKVDAAGGFSSFTDFSAGYHITDCFGGSQRICNGISVIETSNYGNGENYALAVITEGSLLFATLDASGNPINTASWPISPINNNTQRPKIIESTMNPGQYYICGSVNRIGYVIKVTYQGFVLWSNWYQPGSGILEPRDIIESPYTADQLIVVGRIDVLPAATAADAFFMTLGTGAGNFLSCKYYNFLSWDSDDWFSRIKKADSPTGSDGFILVGRAHGPLTPPVSSGGRLTNLFYTPWFCKLDRLGNVVWSSLIRPTVMYDVLNFSSPGEITDVYERLNQNNGQYEYYGVSGQDKTSAGNAKLTVYKLDDNGTKGLLNPTEFHYSLGRQVAFPGPYTYACLTAFDDIGGNNNGFQAFGTAGYGNHYFVKSYFNGEAGCLEILTNIDSVKQG